MIDSTAGKIVLITGANQGLGFEVVKKLAAENEHYQIIIGARSPAKGRKAAAEVTSLAKGTAVDVLEIDVTSDESVERQPKLSKKNMDDLMCYSTMLELVIVSIRPRENSFMRVS